MSIRPLLLTLAIAAACAPALAQDDAATGPGTAASTAKSLDLDVLAKDVRKSLVLVEYTYRDVNNSREEVGQGIVVAKDTVLIWGGFISESIPKDYIKEIKVRVPGKNFSTVPAKLLGRTQNRLFAYVKADKPLDASALSLDKTADVKLGQRVAGVALLDKAGGYETYTGAAAIRAILRRSFVTAATDSFGLTRACSPVFDAGSGALVGVTMPSSGEEMLLRDPTFERLGMPSVRRVELYDEQQSSDFLPLSEVKKFLTDVPTKPFESPRPWAGLDNISGLEEAQREHHKIDQLAGVSIGSVVPGQAADKAGLQPLDIVLTVDGKPFSESPVADIMRAHFLRALELHKPGDTLKLGVLRGGKRIDVPMTLGTTPKLGGDMPHIYEPKVGLVTRDLVFSDTYVRKLPTDTKGVMVAQVKNGAPASLGQTPLRPGFIITKINDQPVEDQKQFAELLKKEEADTEKKELVFVVLQADGETKVCRIDMAK